MRTWIIIAAAALAGCGANVPQGPSAGPRAPVAATPNGPAESVTARTEDEVQREASVTEVAPLKNGAKVFSTAGGDPAINGLFTYIAAYVSPMDGWKVFQIGDFNSWRLLEERESEVVLEVSRSWLDENGEVKTATEKRIVSIPTESSEAITVTPAT